MLITPQVGNIRWDQTRRADELLQAGYDAAMESIDKIKSLITREFKVEPETVGV